MKSTRDYIITAIVVIFLLVTGMGAIRMESSEQILTRQYFTRLNFFHEQMMDLQEAVNRKLPADSLQNKFKRARLTYKSVELFIEYYFPNYYNLLNPPPIRMAEDHQDPQGMQVIEEQVFKEGGPGDYRKLLGDMYKLNGAIYSLVEFERIFSVNNYLPDALIEELYRIIALGITGFDSPVSLQSIPENAVAIRSVRESLEIAGAEWAGSDQPGYLRVLGLLEKAEQYCMTHQDFDGFDRMHLIREYLNPACEWLGKVKLERRVYDKVKISTIPQYSAVAKYYSLFDYRFVSPRFFSADSSMPSPEMIAIGRKLFADPVLAGNNQRSCASCHDPAKGFTDGLERSLTLDGINTVPRNAPTLWNSSLQRDLFYDHRQRFMENLVDEVLANKDEMNSSAQLVAEKITTREDYRDLALKAFGDANMTPRRVNKAIASYVRSLISLNSRFDLYMRGHQGAMTKEEILGFNIFMGKGKCGTCHFVPLFNGSKPPLFNIIESEVIGVPGNADSLHPVADGDIGRIKISGNPVHDNSFKTPTVRNIELTGPYMHNGVYKTLEEVVEFYNKGGGAGLGIPIQNQTLPFDKLSLSGAEKKALVAFMRSLTDTTQLKEY
jgi:cytochrome c peroxidase